MVKSYFGISPQIFYRWLKRFNPRDLTTLESRSSRPLRVRQPATPPDLVEKIKQLKEQYSRWRKDKLVILLNKELRKEGKGSLTVSVSTIGSTY